MYSSNVMKHHHHSNIQSASSHQPSKLIKKHKLQQDQHQDDVYSVPRSVSTDDDDDDDDKIGKENISTKQAKSSVRNSGVAEKSNNSVMVVENYLLRYEHMVRQQEMEEKAVMAHLLPCIHRLLELIHDQKISNSSNHSEQQNYPLQLHHEISYHQLYHAYQQLTQLKTISSSTTTNSSLTITAMECMTTDRQLMMILRTMTEKMNLNLTKNILEEEKAALSISWAEFIQCYRVCIYSMMTLQHLPKGSMARLRARDRSLSIMAMFEPSTTFSISTGFTDLYMSPTHHAVNQPSAIRPTTTQSIHGSLNTNSAAAAIDTTGFASLLPACQRRRPWLKKRTKRTLPYVLFVVLLLAFASLYCMYVMRKEGENNHDDEENNKADYQRGVVVPSSPSKSVVVAVEQKNPSVMVVGHVPVSFQQESIPNGFYNPLMFTSNSKMSQKRHQSDVSAQKKSQKNIKNKAAGKNNFTSTSDIDHTTTPILYHPLLGIWSNFNK